MTRDAAVCLGQMTFGYEVALGARISRDPITNAEMRQGPNLYAYVRNDPTNGTDPLGLFTIGIGIQGSGGAIAGGGGSYGYFVGWSREAGFSHGSLGTLGGGGYLGAGGSAGGFLQVTSAKSFNCLKGLSNEIGGSAGEVVSIGGELINGGNELGGPVTYSGAQLNVGFGGGPIPAEVHNFISNTW